MALSSGWDSDSLLQVLFEEPGACRCLVSGDLRIVRANGEWLRLTGRAERDVLGVDVLDLFSGERASVADAVVRAQGGSRADLGEVVRGGEGAETFWEGAVEPVPREGEKGLLFTLRRRRRAEGTSKALLERRRAGQARLKEAARRDRYRVALSDALRSITDLGEAQGQAARALGEYLGAARVHYAEVSEDGEEAVISAEYRASGVENVLIRYRFDGYGPFILSEIDLGRTVCVEDVLREARITEAERGSTLALGIHAYAIQPLERSGRLSGVLVVRYGEPHVFTEDERVLIRETAERTWSAIWRVRAEQALMRSEDELRLANERLSVERSKLEAIIGVLPVGVVICDAEGHPTSMNATALRCCGFDGSVEVSQVLPRLEELVEVQDLGGEGIGAGGLALCPGGSGAFVANEELRLCNLRKGTSTTVSGSTVPVRSQDGELSLLVWVIEDVTERRVQEKRYRSLFENSLDAVYVTQKVGQILDANRAACEMHGMTVEEIRRRGQDGILVPDRRMARFIEERTATGRSRGEVEMRRKDGSTFPVEIEAVTVDPHGPEPTGFVIARDISERKRSEAERDRLAMVVEQSAEEVMVTDRKGVIVYVNPAFESVTGYARAEAVGRRPSFLRSGTHDDDFYRSLWETILAGKVWRGRFVNKKKDGSVITEEATISPVRDGEGSITGFVGMERDITAALAMRAQLEQMQRLEGIGRLAGGVAHDFNNILSVILSYAEFGSENLREGDPQREDFQQIAEAGRRAASLTRQLLAFSRRQVLQIEPLELNRVLVEMEKMLRRIIGEDVRLVQVLAQDLGIVKADPAQLEQVVMNLAVNARDAMPMGGTLTIETANVELNEEYVQKHAGARAGPQVMVEVTDTGVGMDEATLNRIFEPFFTTKAPGQGSGLGLSTVYGIVNQSGGSIEVKSELGRGTTFKVYLPRVVSDSPVPSRPVPSARSRGEETVLVVEDDEAVRGVARRILESAGYKVLTAANAGEGLLLCEQHPAGIDLVLTDVVMPMMSGRAFVERLGQVRPGMKVLFMSGYTNSLIDHQGVLEPGTKFISKPITQGELLRKVREAIDG